VSDNFITNINRVKSSHQLTILTPKLELRQRSQSVAYSAPVLHITTINTVKMNIKTNSHIYTAHLILNILQAHNCSKGQDDLH